MSGYLARRLLLTIPIMIVVSMLVFSIIRLIPGDPVLVILGLRATPENIAVMRRDLQLDQPIWVQYLTWAGKAVRGDLGVDYRTSERITDQLLMRLPVTLEMAFLALLMSAVIAIPLGILAAVRRRGAAEHGALLLGLFGISIPDFWLGVMLILVVSLLLGWLPSSGFVPLHESLWGNISHLLLPSFTLALNLAAVSTRTTRAAVLEVLNREYVRTARAKGLAERAVVLGHVLKNAAIPIITVIGMQVGYVLGGAIVIEYVFSLPGIGKFTLDSVLQRNYPVIQGVVLLVTFSFLLVNILTDLLYAALDPRIRHALQ